MELFLSNQGKPVINEKVSGYDFLKRPDVGFDDLENISSVTFDMTNDIKEQALIEIKYSGYIQKAYNHS